MKHGILVVDDEKAVRELMQRALSRSYRVSIAPDADGAMNILAADPSIALMITDLKMPGASGIDLLKAAKAKYPKLVVMLLTAHGSVDQAVEAMRDGAEDFLEKPIDLDRLDSCVARAMKTVDLVDQVEQLQSNLDERFGLENIIGSSDAMKHVFHLIRQAGPTDATVLIQGPSGTGKELVAHALHSLSRRSSGPFVAVHCAALTPTLLESELFGHEKGAFTGAVARSIGRFEAANGGTLFLDEISEIDLATQVKLLRVLESRTFQRVGGTETLHTDIRVVAATNRNLREYVADGKFREDLYYRLNVVEIRMPSLKDRVGDLPLIANKYLKDFSDANGGKVTGITPAAMRVLESYDWPGNVRELRNTMERMVVLASNPVLDVGDVPAEISGSAAAPKITGTLGETERSRIIAALNECNGNRSKAAQVLGISRRTLYRKIDEYAKDGISL